MKRELLNHDSLLRSILDTLTVGIACLDREGKILIANKSFSNFLGLTPTLLETNFIREFIENPRYTRHESLISLCLSGREVTFTEEMLIKGRDPEKRFIHGSYSPFIDSEKKVVGIVCTLVDITDLRQAQSALETVNQKLNLLSSITRHDILNSITALIGYLTYAEEEIVNETALPFINKAHRATELIQEQIEFTRDYQELGVEKPLWQNGEIVFNNALDGVKLGEIELSVALSDLEVYADPLLERVIFNLVDNTLRYGEKVNKISSYWYHSDNRAIWVISDDGIGVKSDMKEKIFKKGIGHNTGLGLFLSREILDITGMMIGETGKPGEGAIFKITIPEGTWRSV